MPDYRGYGKSRGFLLSQKTFLKDADFAYAEAKKLFPEEKIIVVGRSLGSGLAVHLAARNRPRRLILISAYTSLKETAKFHYPWIPSFLNRYPMPSERWIGKVACPVTLFHGTEDPVIPVRLGKELSQKVRAPVRWIPLPDAGHDDISDNPQYLVELKKILAESR